jgi:hypothetical protein
MTRRLSRIVAVTAGLAIVGIAGGAALGALLGLALASIPTVGVFASPPLEQFLVGGAICGALVGGLLVPGLVWTRLRAVPLGRVARGIGSAVAVGAAIAWIVQPAWAPVGALVGFLFGVRRLRRDRRSVAV